MLSEVRLLVLVFLLIKPHSVTFILDFKMAFSRFFPALLVLVCLASAAEDLQDKIERILLDGTHSDPDLKDDDPRELSLMPDAPAKEQSGSSHPKANPEEDIPKDKPSKDDKIQAALKLSAEAIGLISVAASGSCAAIVAVLRCIYRWRADGIWTHIQDIWALMMAILFNRTRPARDVIALGAP